MSTGSRCKSIESIILILHSNTDSSWNHSATGHNISSWPAVIGNDGAGIVEDVGPGVNRFKKGDEVFARFYTSSPSGAAFQVRLHFISKPCVSKLTLSSRNSRPRLLQMLLLSRHHYLTRKPRPSRKINLVSLN